MLLLHPRELLHAPSVRAVAEPLMCEIGGAIVCVLLRDSTGDGAGRSGATDTGERRRTHLAACAELSPRLLQVTLAAVADNYRVLKLLPQ